MIETILNIITGCTYAGLAMRYLFSPRKPKEKKEKEKAICLCKHGVNRHDEKGCHWSDTENMLIARGSPKSMLVDGFGNKKIVYEMEDYERVTKTCSWLRYVGPEYLADIIG